METFLVDDEQRAEDYERISEALRYLERNAHAQPELKEVADHLGLSEFHLQRLFTRWVGISPKRFLQYLTKERARRLLAESASLLDVAYETGLSGPGRLHDLFIATEAVTPGEVKNQGEQLSIAYGFHATPFGECLLAVTARGICNLIFTDTDGRVGALAELRRNWLKADLMEDPGQTRPYIRQVFTALTRQEPGSLRLHLRGTNFQIQVWQALLRVPPGSIVSYEDIAVAIGMPKATRAVANAVGANPIPVLIPCHRVIRKMGEFGGYRYGVARKKALLGWEAAQMEQVER